MGKKFAIVAGYVAGESYGLLGPQLAATLIRDHTAYDCMVVAVDRADDHGILTQALSDYFAGQRPIVGFCLVGGRPDLVDLAGALKSSGAITILAGPQADVDFAGEKDWLAQGHRFRGWADSFCFALHGPAEQIFDFLFSGGRADRVPSGPGFLCRDPHGRLHQTPAKTWEAKYLEKVDWSNLYRIGRTGLVAHSITVGQVLQRIGCPHAARKRVIEIGYPAALDPEGEKSIKTAVKGCSFCDVAVDKGFFGKLETQTVLRQIAGLPDGEDGRKIPFELIDETPLPSLPDLMEAVRRQNLAISKIHLTTRADWFVAHNAHLERALRLARDMNVHIVLTAMGFESFDDGILKNLNKQVTVATNLAAVRLIRRFKRAFPDAWGYLRSEGGNHGFIHPTPWDSESSAANIHTIVASRRLHVDILPEHSTPLIIHHASWLGDWIRAIESRENVTFERHGSIVAWWQIGDRFLL